MYRVQLMVNNYKFQSNKQQEANKFHRHQNLQLIIEFKFPRINSLLFVVPIQVMFLSLSRGRSVSKLFAFLTILELETSTASLKNLRTV